MVTPHRAQQGLIASRLVSVFGATGQMADAIRDAVDTVERFQGQQRDIIVASYTLGDPDQIAEEDEFLMSLNRFNVIASRARAKLIVLVSQDVPGAPRTRDRSAEGVPLAESLRRGLLSVFAAHGPRSTSSTAASGSCRARFAGQPDFTGWNPRNRSRASEATGSRPCTGHTRHTHTRAIRNFDDASAWTNCRCSLLG